MAAWFIVIGVILITMALLGSVVDRLPLSSALIYLAIGVVLGPGMLGWLDVEPMRDGHLLEPIFLVAVLVSLFTVGLKLRTPTALFTRDLWRLPLRLAGPSMVVTIALVAMFAVVVFDFSWGAAILLGGILAPTDPVLASDIQVRHENDRDDARFALSAEGGLNDATASPFVLLGLGLLGLHELGAYGWRWFGIDLVWGGVVGFGIGWLGGLGVGTMVLKLRKQYEQAYGLEEFLGLGLIAFAYGIADLVHGIGFLAVLAAGLAMRRFETHDLKDKPRELMEEPLADSELKATLPDEAPTHLVTDVLDFNQRFESIGEVAAVLLVGALLSAGIHSTEGLWLAAALFFVIRPLSVWIGTRGTGVGTRHLRLMGWFGIRGVGTLYYLTFAINHAMPPDLVERIAPLIITVVAASIFVHGISGTPLMERYERGKQRPKDGGKEGPKRAA